MLVVLTSLTKVSAQNVNPSDLINRYSPNLPHSGAISQDTRNLLIRDALIKQRAKQQRRLQQNIN